MALRKVHEPSPIVFEQIVRARAEVITDAAHLKSCIGLGILRCIEATKAIELVDRRGMERAQKFAFRIAVLAGARDIDRTRSTQSDQLMEIDGQGLGVTIGMFVVLAKPMRKNRVDPLDELRP